MSTHLEMEVAHHCEVICAMSNTKIIVSHEIIHTLYHGKCQLTLVVTYGKIACNPSYVANWLKLKTSNIHVFVSLWL